MTKGGHTPKEVPEFRRLLADNLSQLMRRAAIDERGNDLRKAAGLAKAAGVDRKTIDRMRRPEKHPSSPNLDSVVAVFGVLGKEPWEILLPMKRTTPVIDGHQAASNNGSAVRNTGQKAKRFKGS